MIYLQTISKSEHAVAKQGEKRLMVKVIKAVGLGLKQGTVSRSVVMEWIDVDVWTPKSQSIYVLSKNTFSIMKPVPSYFVDCEQNSSQCIKNVFSHDIA